jgi:hypothetical protein
MALNLSFLKMGAMLQKKAPQPADRDAFLYLA